MGASVESVDGHAPLTIRGAALRGVRFEPERPSAQVKSAVLLAGLHASSETTVIERTPTRDHTEVALRAFGARVIASDESITVQPGGRLRGLELSVPGDISSAAFWMVAAAGIPDSDLLIEDVGLNRSRTAFVDLLRRAGADVAVDQRGEAAGEPSGAVRVRHRDLRPLTIAPSEVAASIDELPALAALSAFGADVHVAGASELRLKEADRIAALVAGFRALGADADEHADGFSIRGSAPWTWRGGEPDAAGDHRLAMTFAIAALGAAGPSHVRNAESVAISYPRFFEVLSSLDP
jgi:3-phosphoshikimate 1-carboxyvinyltransferase